MNVFGAGGAGHPLSKFRTKDKRRVTKGNALVEKKDSRQLP